MALKFKCKHCEYELISEWLNIGQPYMCINCDNRTKIPEDAEEVEGRISFRWVKFTEKSEYERKTT